MSALSIIFRTGSQVYLLKKKFINLFLILFIFELKLVSIAQPRTSLAQLVIFVKRHRIQNFALEYKIFDRKAQITLHYHK